MSFIRTTPTIRHLITYDVNGVDTDWGLQIWDRDNEMWEDIEVIRVKEDSPIIQEKPPEEEY